MNNKPSMPTPIPTPVSTRSGGVDVNTTKIQADAFVNTVIRRKGLSLDSAAPQKINQKIVNKVASSKLMRSPSSLSNVQNDELSPDEENLSKGHRDIDADDANNFNDPSMQVEGASVKPDNVYVDTEAARKKKLDRDAKRAEQNGETLDSKGDGKSSKVSQSLSDNKIKAGTSNGKANVKSSGTATTSPAGNVTNSKLSGNISKNITNAVVNKLAAGNPQAAKVAEVAANVEKVRRLVLTIRLIWTTIASAPVLVPVIVVVLIVVLLFVFLAAALKPLDFYGGTTNTQGLVSLNNITPESAAVSDVELMPAIMRQIEGSLDGSALLDTSTEEVRTRLGKIGDVNNRNQTNSARLAALTVEAVSNLLNSGYQAENEIIKKAGYKDSQQDVLKRAFVFEGGDREYKALESRSLSYPYVQNRPDSKDDELDPETNLPIKNRPVIGPVQAEIIEEYLKQEVIKAQGQGVMSLNGKMKGGEDDTKEPENIYDLTGFKTDEVKVLIDGLKVNMAWDGKEYIGEIVKTYSSATDKVQNAKFTDLSEYFGSADKTGATDPNIAVIEPIRAEKRTAIFETLGHPPIDRGEVPKNTESVLKTLDTASAAGINKDIEQLGYSNDDLINETFGSFIKGNFKVGLEFKTDSILGGIINPILKFITSAIQEFFKTLEKGWQFPTYTNRFYELENWKRKTLQSLDQFNPNNNTSQKGIYEYNGPINNATYVHLADRSAVFGKVIDNINKLFDINIDPSNVGDINKTPKQKVISQENNELPGKIDINIDPEIKEKDLDDDKLKEGTKGFLEIILDKLNILGKIFNAFNAEDEVRPVYSGKTIDDILAQSMKDLRSLNLDRTVQGANFQFKTDIVVNYSIIEAPPFIIINSININPPHMRINYAKKVISNGPNNEEILNLVNNVQKAVLRSVVDERWQNLENQDRRGYIEPINIANNGAFKFGQEQVDKYIAQLEEFRDKVKRKQYTENTTTGYGAINSVNYTGSGSARSWTYINKYEPEYVNYLKTLGINSKEQYYRAVIINEFASQGVTISEYEYANSLRDKQAAAIIAAGISLAEEETNNFTEFRALNPLPACDSIYTAKDVECLDSIKTAQEKGIVRFIIEMILKHLGSVLSELANPKTWTLDFISVIGKKIASMATGLTETYGPLGKGAVDTIWAKLTDLLKEVQVLKLGKVDVKMDGRAQDITIGMISGFNTFADDTVNDKVSLMNQYIPDGETGVTYDGRGFMPKSFAGKKLYEKFQENYLTGVDLMKNPNLLAQTQDDVADASLAAFILVRNVINGDIDGKGLNFRSVGNVSGGISRDEYKLALKAMSGNLPDTKLLDSENVCVAIPFMGKTNNYLNTGITLSGSGDVLAYRTGNVLQAKFTEDSGTITIRVPNPTNQSRDLIVRYSGLDPTKDPLQIKEKFDKLGKPKAETVNVRAGEKIGFSKGLVKIEFLRAITNKDNQIDFEQSTLTNPLSKIAGYLQVDKYPKCAGAEVPLPMLEPGDYDYEYNFDRTTPRAKRSDQASLNF